MSLINDALKRASKAERDRPRRTSTPTGMEPVPAAQSSRLPVVVAVVVLAALLLAGWFFWQLWMARNDFSGANMAANIAPPAAPHVVPPPVAVKAAPVAPAAPAPVVAAAPPVVAPPIAMPAEPPSAAKDSQPAWPVNLKLNALLYGKTNAQVLINGNLYRVGDDIKGVVVKKIEQDKVTLEWNGQTKELMMEKP